MLLHNTLHNTANRYQGLVTLIFNTYDYCVSYDRELQMKIDSVSITSNLMNISISSNNKMAIKTILSKSF